MSAVVEYINKNRQRYVDELFDLLRMPTISADSTKKQELVKCAEWLVAHLKQIGLNASVEKTPGHPIVYGEWLGRPGKPTVLYYGHYDVQPVDPLNLWHTPPFEPTVKDGKVYARGSADDKGQFYTHIKAVEAFFKTAGGPPVNVKFLIEGEEEASGSNLDSYIETHREKLACDEIIVSDSAQFDETHPGITYGLRGIVYMEVIVTGPNRDLHSGEYGGAVHNPANVLAQMIAKLHHPDGRVAIDGFYDDVRPLTREERDEFLQLPFDREKYKEDLGVDALFGEAGFTELERLWTRPTCDVNGLYSGYMGEGSKTVIPSKAGAKISMRMVPDMDPNRIEYLFKSYIEKIAPKTVKLQIITHGKAWPVVVSTDSPSLNKARKAIEKGFGARPVLMRCGGAIPVVGTFKKELKASALLMGFGLPDDNLHSPNEKFSLENYQRGILTSAYMMEELAG